MRVTSEPSLRIEQTCLRVAHSQDGDRGRGWEVVRDAHVRDRKDNLTTHGSKLFQNKINMFSKTKQNQMKNRNHEICVK